MCDCKKCGDSMSIPYGYEVTDFCNECAQEIVIELEADIKKINRACTEYKATINRMDKNAGQMDLNYGRMVLERDTIRAENAKLKSKRHSTFVTSSFSACFSLTQAREQALFTLEKNRERKKWKDTQAENAELKEELSEANIQIKQYQKEVAELEDKIEAYTSQGE